MSSEKKEYPGFLFDGRAWLSSASVQVMTLSEQGAYMRLLCYCWDLMWKGSALPDDDAELARLSGLGMDWEKGSGAKIRKCFYKHRGKLRNKRLDFEKKRVEAWQEKSRRGGESSAKSRKEKRLGDAEHGKQGSGLVPTKPQPTGNQKPSNHNINNNTLNTQHTYQQSLCTRRARDGRLICFEVDSKRVELKKEIIDADHKLVTVLFERLRPLNGTRVVLQDIAGYVTAMAHGGRMGVFDEAAQTARAMVADAGIENPTGAFVEHAKKNWGYVPRG